MEQWFDISTWKDNFYYVLDILDNLFIIKEYVIKPDDDLITQSKYFILRYRRIIGIILLIILLYIAFTCKFNENTTRNSNEYTNEINTQKGGAGGYNFGAFAFDPRAREEMALRNEIPKKHDESKKRAAIQAKLEAKDAKEAADKKTADEQAAAEAEKKKIADAKAAKKRMSRLDKSKASAKIKSEKAKEAFKGTAAGKKIAEMKEMRRSGFSKKAVAGRMMYQAGAYTGEKFKEFAGWLYQILFTIAISIAICMVVLPSISFFIVGIICFFLLKSKMSSFKSL
jgi:flagellar biosynthesis GTPase FlhF